MTPSIRGLFRGGKRRLDRDIERKLVILCCLTTNRQSSILWNIGGGYKESCKVEPYKGEPSVGGTFFTQMGLGEMYSSGLCVSTGRIHETSFGVGLRVNLSVKVDGLQFHVFGRVHRVSS